MYRQICKAMSSSKLIFTLVIFASSLFATGAAPLENDTPDVNDPIKRVKTYSALGGTKKVTITDDRIEIVVTGQEKGANASQIFKELKSLQENNKAVGKRLQTLEKLHGNDFSFLFPKKGTADYALLRGMPSLRAVTGCMWMQSSNTDTSGCPLSYAVSGSTNELTIYNYKDLLFGVGSQYASPSAGAVNDGRWHHICFTWEDAAGSWNIYLDGSQKATGTGLKRGHVIRGGGVLMLGQEQDAVGGSLSAGQSFIGEMSQVNLWNRVLSPQEIAEMSKSCSTREGNVFKWSDFRHGIHGAVQRIEPSPCRP